jgi:pyruvate/2-oxoglutarate dehydrogenase complex dihydrolipoamide acyltransferase (E2) component
LSEANNMIDIVAPKSGLDVDGEIVEWKKSVGDPVSEGEVLVEVETDKSVEELESEDGGVLVEILAEAGDVVKPGQVIGRIEASG